MQYNDPMPKPSLDEVAGYDVVIWIDNDGDPIISAYSELGERYLESVIPNRDKTKELVIHTENPETFMRSLPMYLISGVQNPQTKEVHPVKTKVLQ